MEPQTISFISLAVAVTMAVLGIAEKLWGGGNALASKFNKLERETSAAIAMVRNEYQIKLDTYAENTRVATASIISNIHLLEKGILEFRLLMAEQYMRRDSFYKATDELKRDFKDAN